MVRNDGKMATRTERDNPEWVEDACTAVIEMKVSGDSILHAFDRASPDLSNRDTFCELVSKWLQLHPEIVRQWSFFSCDTRATPWPYFLLDQLKVGFLTVVPGIGVRDADVRIWNSGADACADYLYRAFKWVLQREQ